jgi:hypothetical protein
MASCEVPDMTPMTRTGQEPQPQAPPQHPPPAGAAPPAEPDPVSATVVSSLTVSSWPSGQRAGSADWLIGRLTSNSEAHSRQEKA